eukprot:GHVS01053271.1.p2 GENE.GHVS01053271.1~~GHVS01053271.1.p2  ORF type:complete len:166 (+),score=46.26 GHVS01053271.1:308-805(+)
MATPPSSPSALLSSPFHLPAASPSTSSRPPRVPPLHSVSRRALSKYHNAPTLSSHRTSSQSSSGPLSDASPFTLCCHYLSHFFCGTGSLCHPARCVIDQNEVEVIPGTARTNITTSRSSRPQSTARSNSSSARSPHNNNNNFHQPASLLFSFVSVVLLFVFCLPS